MPVLLLGVALLVTTAPQKGSCIRACNSDATLHLGPEAFIRQELKEISLNTVAKEGINYQITGGGDKDKSKNKEKLAEGIYCKSCKFSPCLIIKKNDKRYAYNYILYSFVTGLCV